MTTNLEKLSQDLASVAESAGPSIVRVDARRRMSATGVVWSTDGVIVTANHVVRRDEGIQVGLPDGTTAAATLVGRDPATDLAMLKVDASDLTPATWTDTEELGVGQLVLALGRPGRTVQATLGVVSGLGKSWRTPTGGEIEPYLQTDVTMYPGFSGGPLATASGKFAGINSSKLLRGVSVTVPAAAINKVAAALIAHGRMPRGYLGVGIQPVRLPESMHEALEQETGLMIMSVETESPAASVLLQGDILVQLAGKTIAQLDDLQIVLGSGKAGKEVAATVVRSGETKELTVTIGQK